MTNLKQSETNRNNRQEKTLGERFSRARENTMMYEINFTPDNLASS